MYQKRIDWGVYNVITYKQRERNERTSGRKRVVIYIDEDGNLKKAEGSIEELCGNAASILDMVLSHIESEVEREEMRKLTTESMIEATIRTVMDLGENEERAEYITNACRTIGETGKVEGLSNYISYGAGEGVTS